MRKLFILLSMALSMSASAHVFATPAPDCLAGGDNPFPHSPFPLTCPQSFPLKSMEGVWELLDAGDDVQRYSAFAFEKQIDCESRELLRIRQFNIITGEVLAEGVGYRQDMRDVKALMKGKTGNYMLFVGVYKNVDPNSKYPLNFVAPVLRLVPIDGTGSSHGYVIRQLDLAKTPQVRKSSTLTCDQ